MQAPKIHGGILSNNHKCVFRHNNKKQLSVFVFPKETRTRVLVGAYLIIFKCLLVNICIQFYTTVNAPEKQKACKIVCQYVTVSSFILKVYFAWVSE